MLFNLQVGIQDVIYIRISAYLNINDRYVLHTGNNLNLEYRVVLDILNQIDHVVIFSFKIYRY